MKARYQFITDKKIFLFSISYFRIFHSLAIVTILLRYKQRANKISLVNRWSIRVLSCRSNLTTPAWIAGITPSRDRHSTSAKSKSISAARHRKDHVQEQGRRNIRKNIYHRAIHRIDKTDVIWQDQQPAHVAASGPKSTRRQLSRASAHSRSPMQCGAMLTNAKGNRLRYRFRLDSV